MHTHHESLFEAFLNQHDDRAWATIVDKLLPRIHRVDQNGVRIWFAFYPLALARALQQSNDLAELERRLGLQGTYFLKNVLDTSHEFLYGHRFWPEVKAAVIAHAASSQPASSLDLAEQIREVAARVAKHIGADESLLIAITAVAFMTLQQVGIETFKATPGLMKLPRKVVARTPEQILSARAKDDDQGIFGFLRGEKKEFTIVFNENVDDAKFTLINSQHITTAAAEDKRPHHLRDSRCTVNEGAIPVHCRAASCGTCWIGVLGGAEKLSEVGALESRRIKEFGYIETDEPQPLIRLACQSQAFGAVSIVIPPWNGVFGKFLRQRKAEEAEAQVGE